jgi:AraC-like DNA-binding protein
MRDPCLEPAPLLGRTDEDRLHRAAELYLNACYAERTAARADEFAQQLSVSRYQLHRKSTGASLRALLREKQLAYAQRLLRTTNAPVDEIAIASAFGTPWTFARCFKSHLGMTPGAYRRTQRAAQAARNEGGDLTSRRLSRR